MSGISSESFWATTKIKTTFLNSKTGGVESGTGTGFWVVDKNGVVIFVTNKHVVDYELKTKKQNFSLHKVEIGLRKKEGNNYAEGSFRFFEVENIKDSLMAHKEADCAIFYNPSFKNKPPNYNLHKALAKLEEMADQTFFAEKVNPLYNVSFIGFPGKYWEDELTQLPIARSAVIASLPHISMNNEYIRTKDVTLVSGFSFGGSSGSPVILNEKGIKTSPSLKGGNYIAPKLIGIMSGHWHDTENRDEHKGISYYTRSTAILDLIKNIKQKT